MKELVSIQSKLKAPKGQFNKFGKYKYRSCEDILESVKPLLAEENCALIISDQINEVGGKIYITATAQLVNSEGKIITVSASAREAETKAGMDVAQITGAASSYARKYALNGLFCIDDTKDPDATNKHDKEDAEPETEITVEDAIKQVKAVKNRTELVAIYNSLPQFQTNTAYMEAFKEMGAKFPKQTT